MTQRQRSQPATLTLMKPAPLIERTRDAIVNRDPEAFVSLLAEDVRWGDDGHPRSCRNRSDVRRMFAQALTQGTDAELVDLVEAPRGMLATLRIFRTGESEEVVFHAYLVTDGLIGEVRRFEDHESAISTLS
jgi:hypothetical protein